MPRAFAPMLPVLLRMCVKVDPCDTYTHTHNYNPINIAGWIDIYILFRSIL